jgi:glycosyltransferase involved in cell wall biosynthesis
MPRIFIVYYSFKNTAGNHAGMAYLAKVLKDSGNQIQLLANLPQEYKGGRYLSRIHAFFLSLYLVLILKKNDKVFFFEYLTKEVGHQEKIADTLRSFGKQNQLYGLVHLSGAHLLELYHSKSTIQKALGPLNKIMVLGSSLQSFLSALPLQQQVVSTFHYVDTTFYHPIKNSVPHKNLQVLSVGSLKRNFALLQQLVKECPQITFHICMGNTNLQHLFAGMPNVQLYPYLPEKDILALMQQCQAAISVMEDTVGSNVITSAMAAGLVQVVSDVGSIRDYCTTETAYLCSQPADFIQALQTLQQNPLLVKTMQYANRQAALHFSKENFIQVFNAFVE